MAGGTNTLETLLAEIVRREKNALEIIEALHKATTSNQKEVSIVFVKEDGTEEELKVPSFGYILSEVKRVEKNLENVSGLSAKSAFIRLEDGKTKKIILSELLKEPERITGLVNPVNFSVKNNSIFEQFVDPLLLVSFDITGKVDQYVDKVYVRKYRLNLDTPEKTAFFEQKLKNRSNILHEDFTKDTDSYGITLEIDQEVKTLPPNVLRYSGNFSISGIRKETKTESADGETFTINRSVYRIDRVTYGDNITGKNDVNLKVGDRLIVNGKSNNTRYEVTSVDFGTKEITLLRKEGFDDIGVGVDVLSIDSPVFGKKEVQVNINVNEHVVVFFKQILNEQNIISTKWSDGISFSSNDLKIPTNSGGEIPLMEYYRSYVVDLGVAIKNMAKENKVPLRNAVKPLPPTLDESNFKVEVINNHKNDAKLVTDIKNKQAKKTKLFSEIESEGISIASKKEEISTKVYKTAEERAKDKRKLDEMINGRILKVKEYGSLVNELVSIGKSSQIAKPKYRAKGYWAIPKTAYFDEAAKLFPQDVIGFKINYRYLSVNGTSDGSKEFKFTDNDGSTRRASDSRWIPLSSLIRRKSVDENGQLVWEVEDVENSDKININQLSISISGGESVEIRIKSISEVGYPTTPIESDWSTSVIIKFPEELESEANIQFIIDDALNEEIRVRFSDELSQRGIDQHIADQFNSANQFFAHHASSIATNQRTPENKPIPADQVIDSLQLQIDQLKAQINGSNGEIEVKLTDSQGNVLKTISNNDTVSHFAGYYTDLISSAAVRKGEIVTQTYYIEISNLSPAQLSLLGYLPGSYTERLPDSSYTGYIIDKPQYNDFRKYWLVPISLRSVLNDTMLFNHYGNNPNPWINTPIFQSFQSKGQYIYGRYTDITLNNKLYTRPALPADEVFLPTQIGGATSAFVWDETQTLTNPSGGGVLTEFCVHIEHPDLLLGTTFMSNFSNLYDLNGRIPNSNLGPNNVYYPQFMHSRYFNLEESEVDGKLQLENIEFTQAIAIPTIAQIPRKFGFSVNDKYLIGKNTCGSYLYLAPSDHKIISINGVVYNETKNIEIGEKNTLRLAVIFQSRMTDYHGAGSSGTGLLGGFGTVGKTNLKYTKKIGIDISPKNQTIFSFDLEFKMVYKPESISAL